MKSIKDSTLTWLNKTVSIILAVSAVWLLMEGKDGWGWFLFGSIVIELEGIQWKNDDPDAAN